jgi:hypothetical protein
VLNAKLNPISLLRNYIETTANNRKDMSTVLGITGVFDAKIDPDGVLKKPVPPIVKSPEPKKELVKLKPIPLLHL